MQEDAKDRKPDECGCNGWHMTNAGWPSVHVHHLLSLRKIERFKWNRNIYLATRVSEPRANNHDGA